jgi:hypothetical protein
MKPFIIEWHFTCYKCEHYCQMNVPNGIHVARCPHCHELIDSDGHEPNLYHK